jgi:hypothetical protein
MEQEILSAMKRGRQYWFVDGFTEMLAGALLGLVGGVACQRGLAPQAPFPTQFLFLSVDVTVAKVVGLSVAALLLWWLKNHFTYPRTGFVRGRQVAATETLAFIGKIIGVGILVLLAAAAAIWFVPTVRLSLFPMPAWLPMALALLWAGLIVVAAEWLGLARFRFVAAWVLLSGIAIGAWQILAGVPPVPPDAFQASAWAAWTPSLSAALIASLNRTLASVGVLVLLTGVALLASGAVTFFRYRRANPLPYKEEA